MSSDPTAMQAAMRKSSDTRRRLEEYRERAAALRAEMQRMADAGMSRAEVMKAVAGMRRLSGDTPPAFSSVAGMKAVKVGVECHDGRVSAWVYGREPTELANGVVR